MRKGKQKQKRTHDIRCIFQICSFERKVFVKSTEEEPGEVHEGSTVKVKYFEFAYLQLLSSPVASFKAQSWD